MIVGCDLHTRYHQVAMLDTETGELVERQLEHESGEARAFYAALSGEWSTFSGNHEPCLAYPCVCCKGGHSTTVGSLQVRFGLSSRKKKSTALL